MKEIKLSRGYSAIVDDDDFPELSRYKWHVQKGKNYIYAVRSITSKNSMLMHRQIMNANQGQIVDHKNGNGPDPATCIDGGNERVRTLELKASICMGERGTLQSSIWALRLPRSKSKLPASTAPTKLSSDISE